jgi:hypothetical protein
MMNSIYLNIIYFSHHSIQIIFKNYNLFNHFFHMVVTCPNFGNYTWMQMWTLTFEELKTTRNQYPIYYMCQLYICICKVYVDRCRCLDIMDVWKLHNGCKQTRMDKHPYPIGSIQRDLVDVFLEHSLKIPRYALEML